MPGFDIEQPEPDQQPQVFQETPEFQFEATDELHDGAKIVIMSLNTDGESRLTDAVFLIPEHLKGAEISANDNLLDDAAWVDDEVELRLQETAAARTVIFTFQKDSQLAFCTINTDELTEPEGDCSW